MMPRPILRDNFHLTYRKIPVLAIGREVRPFLYRPFILSAQWHGLT